MVEAQVWEQADGFPRQAAPEGAMSVRPRVHVTHFAKEHFHDSKTRVCGCFQNCGNGAGVALGISQKITPSPTTQPSPTKAIYHFEWQKVFIGSSRVVPSGPMNRWATLTGLLKFDRVGSLFMVSNSVIWTGLKINGTTRINKPNETPSSCLFRHISEFHLKYGYSTNLSLPLMVQPRDTLNLIKGYMPAIRTVKSDVRAFPLDHLPTTWVVLGKPYNPMWIKFTKTKINKHMARFEGIVLARSYNTLMLDVPLKRREAPGLPQIGRVWLEDAHGDKQRIHTDIDTPQTLKAKQLLMKGSPRKRRIARGSKVLRGGRESTPITPRSRSRLLKKPSGYA